MPDGIDELYQGFQTKLEALIVQARVEGGGHVQPFPKMSKFLKGKSYLDYITKNLARSMARVNRETNYHVGIGRLPDEVLGRIMTYYVWISKLTRLRHMESPKTWKVLCLVCTRWRNVAFHTPSLWNQISFSWEPRLVNLFFERNGVCPLSLFAMAITDRYGDAFKERLEKEVDRISRLFVGWIPDAREESAYVMDRFLEDQLCSKELPNLTNLYLSYGKAMLSESTAMKPPNAPNLLLLEVRGIKFLPSTISFPKLRALKIRDSPMTISEIFSFLTSCPSLGILTISRRPSSYFATESDLSMETFSLPKLKKVTVRYFNNSSLSLLLNKLIESAPSASFDLSLSDVRGAQTLDKMFPETLVSLLRSSPEISIDVFNTYLKDETSYILTFAPKIQVKVERCSLDLKGLLSALIQLGVPQLRNIKLKCDRLPDVESLAEFFVACPDLLKIGLETKELKPFFTAMKSDAPTKDRALKDSEENSEGATSQTTPLILPHLGELNIFESPYSRSDLKNFLSDRQDRGAKVHCLKMAHDDEEWSYDDIPLKDIKALVDVFKFVPEYRRQNQNYGPRSEASSGLECHCEGCLSEEYHNGGEKSEDSMDPLAGFYDDDYW
ncbi:hypothetical protein SISNIDRAFT_453089 [Sistotremastrum niveocremeum HHB9708]|uniref:F-box domain-containing protein n=1 Tax=Sistotremastrum niveocremeum HHB9708 TaxID=1314777 RepID=A0A164WC88_9AGAM|nr:hypothetical protein SISNIDRAFT_453089 [Sistotremastrum niveocremeum HHB9708]